MTVNVSKTKFMIFHKRRDTPQLDLLLNNIKIELVSNFTFLGIILDPSQSWKYHTKIIIKMININKENNKMINDYKMIIYQNIKNNWYFTQVKIYFSENINNIQITNCATFELWSPIMGSKS